MYPSELVGKLVLRNTPVIYPTSSIDRSYSHGSPIKILKVTDYHMTIYNPKYDCTSVLDLTTWGGDNWTDYNTLKVKSLKLFGKRIFII